MGAIVPPRSALVRTNFILMTIVCVPTRHCQGIRENTLNSKTQSAQTTAETLRRVSNMVGGYEVGSDENGILCSTLPNEVPLSRNLNPAQHHQKTTSNVPSNA